MLAVLIGEGPNGLEIPALVFSSMEVGLEKCRELLDEDDENVGREYRWVWKEGIPMDIAKKVYKRYYGGCGECYAFTLKEVEEGKPFVGWDLD